MNRATYPCNLTLFAPTTTFSANPFTVSLKVAENSKICSCGFPTFGSFSVLIIRMESDANPFACITETAIQQLKLTMQKHIQLY